MDSNIMKLELNKPNENVIYNHTISNRVKSMLNDLYDGKINSIRISYTRTSTKGIIPIYIMWYKYMESSSEQFKYQRFACKCYDKNKPDILLFDFEVFDNSLKPSDPLIHQVLPVGEMISKVKLTRRRNNKDRALIPILDEWISIDEKPNEMSIQFRIANMYKMYVSSVPVFTYGDNDLALGLPIYDRLGTNIIGCVGRKVQQTGNYSLLRLSGMTDIVNLNSGHDIMISFCNNSDTRVNIHKDYDVQIMSHMDINDIRHDEFIEIMPKEFPTRISVNQMKDYVIINYINYDSITDTTIQMYSSKIMDDNIIYYINTQVENGFKRTERIIYSQVEIKNKKKK